MKKIITYTLLPLFTISATAQDMYTVQEGDTLSSIIQRYTSPPPSLYGENGRLAKIISLNPEIENTSLIFAGDTVRLRSFDSAPVKV